MVFLQEPYSISDAEVNVKYIPAGYDCFHNLSRT